VLHASERVSVLWQPTLYLDVSGLQQPVLPLDVSGLQQHVLPLDVSVLQQLVLPRDVFLLQKSVLSLDVSVCLFYSSLYFVLSPELSSLCFTGDLPIQQQPVLCQEVHEMI
jgi:hypothetical protein